MRLSNEGDGLDLRPDGHARFEFERGGGTVRQAGDHGAAAHIELYQREGRVRIVGNGDDSGRQRVLDARSFDAFASDADVARENEHPGAMTHASVAGTTLEVPANLVRLSVGIEGADDLIADLEQAFAAI